MLSININSNATRQMKTLINKVDTFPNRIASAQQSALHRSANSLYYDLYSRFLAAKYLDMEISARGNLGYSLKISPAKNMKTSTGVDAYIAAAVLIKGRKAYRVRGKRGNVMILRQESVPPYPKALMSANIPRMAGRESEIREAARQLIIKNLQYSLERFGFGPQGGTTGLSDLPYVRSRAVR